MTIQTAKGLACTLSQFSPILALVPSLLKNKPVLAWAFYDWANSAFATTVMAGFFPVFFERFWSTGVEPSSTTARLGYANAIAGIALALLAPVLGAIGDRGGRRKRFLFGWTLLGVCATGALYFVGQGQWGTAALMFVLGSMGFNGGIVFNDSLLLDVAKPGEYDRVSAFGYSMGYLGGGLLLALNLVMFSKPAWFGLRDGAHAVQASFMTVAVWWFVFTLPLMRVVREQHRGPHLPFFEVVRVAFRELATTIGHIRQYRTILMFLIAYWFYIDGVNTIIKMAVNYGMALHLDAGKLLLALLVTQLVGFPAALLFGWLGDRIGARRGILIGIAVYAGDHDLRVFPRHRGGVLRAGGHRRARAGRRAEPVALAVRPPGARRQERRVLRFLQHDGQVRRVPRAVSHGRHGRRHAQPARFHRLARDPVRHRWSPALARARHAARRLTSFSRSSTSPGGATLP